jgi:hypothetical protein
MIDPKTDERVGDVYKTEGHPESFQVEAKGAHIFANVPDAGNVVESIDKKTGSDDEVAAEGDYAATMRWL